MIGSKTISYTIIHRCAITICSPIFVCIRWIGEKRWWFHDPCRYVWWHHPSFRSMNVPLKIVLRDSWKTTDKGNIHFGTAPLSMSCDDWNTIVSEKENKGCNIILKWSRRNSVNVSPFKQMLLSSDVQSVITRAKMRETRRLCMQQGPNN